MKLLIRYNTADSYIRDTGYDLDKTIHQDMQDGMHAHILDPVLNHLYQTHPDKLHYLIEQISFQKN